MDQDSTTAVTPPSNVPAETHTQGPGESRNFNLRESISAVVDHFEKLLSKEVVQGHPTGYEKFDLMTNGLKPGDMFVIASRPSMGKSSLMLNIVEYISVYREVPTLIFSGEMSGFQIVQRLIFSKALFPIGQVWSGYEPMKNELQRIQRAALTIASAKIFVGDTANISIDALCSQARRFKDENHIGFIAIDNLHLLKSHSRQARSSREREMSEISAGIKSLAKELAIPILALARLDPDPELRGHACHGVPSMSDLRDSGSLEHDADMIALLHRPANYAQAVDEKQGLPSRADLILTKNRHGETGHQSLIFHSNIRRFEAWFDEKPLE